MRIIPHRLHQSVPGSECRPLRSDWEWGLGFMGGVGMWVEFRLISYGFAGWVNGSSFVMWTWKVAETVKWFSFLGAASPNRRESRLPRVGSVPIAG